MAAPRKYPDELRERATRMAVQSRRDPSTRSGTFRRVGEQLGINPETLRNWVVQAEVDQGHRPGTTTSESQRLVELEKEVRELRHKLGDEPTHPRFIVTVQGVGYRLAVSPP